jgi:hypothetical protein
VAQAGRAGLIIFPERTPVGEQEVMALPLAALCRGEETFFDLWRTD